MNEQITLAGFDDSEEKYRDFLDKFKPKKTTDDCYTPPPVYDAVADYVRQYYKLEGRNFVRPFYPGGDFENYQYQPDDVVVDNPPFSIMTKIITFYIQRKIPFFLFAPGLMIQYVKDNCTFIGCGVDVIYENGANVKTSFITNLEPDIVARSDPELYKIIEKAVREYVKDKKKTFGNYQYDGHVLTAAMVDYLSAHGTTLAIKNEDAMFIRALDGQKAVGKVIFGGALLLSEHAAEEYEAAVLAARATPRLRVDVKRPAADLDVWELSAREREMVKTLGKTADNMLGPKGTEYGSG